MPPPEVREPSARAAAKRRREEVEAAAASESDAAVEAEAEAAALRAGACAAPAATAAAAGRAATPDDAEEEWLGAEFLRDAEGCAPAADLPARNSAPSLGPTAVPRNKQAPRPPRAEVTWYTQPPEKAKAPKTLVLPEWEAPEVRAAYPASFRAWAAAQTCAC